MSERYQHAVSGTSEDPFENILAYVNQRAANTQRAGAAESLDTIRRDALANRRADIECTVLLSTLPKETREEAQALVDDIKVFLTCRRNKILSDAHAGNLRETDLDRLFREGCLSGDPPLDRDMAKTAAQAVIHVFSQSALLRRIADHLDHACEALGTLEYGSLEWDTALARLGRLLVFLRWVPRAWAGENALDTLGRICLQSRKDRLRLWISVLRVFFCHPQVRARNLGEIFRRIRDEFGTKVPMELRGLLRTLLIKGGEESTRLLLARFKEDGDAWETQYYLETLGMIDKGACADWLLRREQTLISTFGVPTYLALLATSGELSSRSRTCLVRLWGEGDAQTRVAVLDAIQDLHFTDLAGMLTDALPSEPVWNIRLRIIETVATVGDLGDLRALAASVRRDRSALRYYTIHLIHGRLLESPMLLLQQDDFLLLHDIQRARSDIHATHQCLTAYRDALSAVLRVFGRKDDGGTPQPIAVGPRLELHAEAQAAVAGKVSSSGQPCARGTFMHAADQATEAYRARLDRFAEAAAVLRDADVFSGRVQRNLFGVIRSRWRRADLLDENDMLLPEGIPQGEERKVLEGILRKTGASIDFIQEYLLWQEWFVREIPFILNEQMPAYIEQIRSGHMADVETVDLADKDARRQLRLTFRAFAECTKQGIYLTDVLFRHLANFTPDQWPAMVRDDFTRRRVMVADGRLMFHPSEPLARHLQFTTFAHDYRYGKESLDQPSLTYLWFRYLKLSKRITQALASGLWPKLPHHPDVPRLIGPLTNGVYRTHEAEAAAVRDFVFAIHDRSIGEKFEMRVIPNLTYGLYCLAPVVDEVVRRGIHVSLAGVSSRFCDDENVSSFHLSDSAVFPLKRYVFSNASNYGTLNSDRLLIVVDGTMEPLDRHDLDKVRLPKAYRGFVNHLAAVNYIRARHGYRMADPEREVASALSLPLRFVKNLVRTRNFRYLVDRLLLCFDPQALARSHAAVGTGRTYYSFAQWNPDGMAARVGPIGYEKREVSCTAPDEIAAPALLFISMNSIFNRAGVAAYFDNNPEVEHPRMYIGPMGAKIDIGWPEEYQGINATQDEHQQAVGAAP